MHKIHCVVIQFGLWPLSMKNNILRFQGLQFDLEPPLPTFVYMNCIQMHLPLVIIVYMLALEVKQF